MAIIRDVSQRKDDLAAEAALDMRIGFAQAMLAEGATCAQLQRRRGFVATLLKALYGFPLPQRYRYLEAAWDIAAAIEFALLMLASHISYRTSRERRDDGAVEGCGPDDAQRRPGFPG